MAERFPSSADLLFHPERCCEFDPFQAVRLLEFLANDTPVRQTQIAWHEVESFVRFRANLTLSFPPSSIAQIVPAASDEELPERFEKRSAERIRNRYKRTAIPAMVVNFFGLFGPNGALPLSYTQWLCDLDTDPKLRVEERQSSRTAFRDWLDIFNNRMTALLFRAWQKYRMPVGYLRTAWRRPPSLPVQNPDRITQVLFHTIGLGTPPLRNRLRVLGPIADDERYAQGVACEPLTRIDDRAILAYAGAFARQRAGAHELRTILADYFHLPIHIQTLTGQWLSLPKATQTKLDDSGKGSRLGIDAVAGEKIWDAGSKFRVRVGPLMHLEIFEDFLPDPTAIGERKGVFLLSQLTRLYVGAELDFEIQLVLFNHQVPECEIKSGGENELGSRLGWNTWLKSDRMPEEVDDVRFDAPCEVVLPG